MVGFKFPALGGQYPSLSTESESGPDSPGRARGAWPGHGSAATPALRVSSPRPALRSPPSLRHPVTRARLTGRPDPGAGRPSCQCGPCGSAAHDPCGPGAGCSPRRSRPGRPTPRVRTRCAAAARACHERLGRAARHRGRTRNPCAARAGRGRRSDGGSLRVPPLCDVSHTPFCPQPYSFAARPPRAAPPSHRPRHDPTRARARLRATSGGCGREQRGRPVVRPHSQAQKRRESAAAAGGRAAKWGGRVSSGGARLVRSLDAHARRWARGKQGGGRERDGKMVGCMCTWMDREGEEGKGGGRQRRGR